MAVIYPKSGECRMTRDPLEKMKWCLQLHGFDGWKGLFWHSAALLKALILIGRTIYAIQTLDQPKKLAELVATYPVRFMAVCKMIVLYVDRSTVDYFYDTIKTEFWDFNIAGPEIEKRILNRFKQVNLMVASHFTASMTALLLLIVFPLVDMPEGQRPLPNIIWTPFDTNPSPLHEILYVVMIWNLSLSINGNAFFDVLYLYSSQHVYVQFILLKELLENITEDIMESYSDLERFHSDYFQEKVIARLNVCIEHHTKLLKFGKKIESFTSVVLVPQLVMSYAVLVINGYILSVDHSEFSKTVMLFNLTGACMIQLAVFAIQASDLKAQSLSVIDAINNTKWYLFRSPVKKALTFMMLNTKKGISITAGGMANVDNEVMVAVCQKALSAITLLRALISEEDSKK